MGEGGTYGSVEEAFVVHGQVEFGLDALDGHHTEPHRDQVEHGCQKHREKVRQEVLAKPGGRSGTINSQVNVTVFTEPGW